MIILNAGPLACQFRRCSRLHSSSANVPELTANADIQFAGVGCRGLIMKKYLLWSVVAIAVLCVLGWVYFFHDYISGERMNWVKYKLGISVSPVVMVGKDGWLFAPGSQEDIDDYRGLANPGDKITRFQKVQKERNEAVKSL